MVSDKGITMVGLAMNTKNLESLVQLPSYGSVTNFQRQVFPHSCCSITLK